jgi:rifampicin phosphotransferase
MVPPQPEDAATPAVGTASSHRSRRPRPRAGEPESVLLRSYEQAFSDGPEIVGGKGWNLSRLARYGFPVPDGGVLAAEGYRRHLEAAGIMERVGALADVSASEADHPDVVARLGQIRTAIESTPLPGEVAASVQRFLNAHDLVKHAVAVRSSAIAEDSAAASFAGIHESVLNVVGLDAVLSEIRTCYASLWTPRALAYRRRLGLTDESVACAVVICAMIGRHGAPDHPPAAAGVAFSADPRTGRRDRAIVNAITGLGDRLVSGQIEPEEIALQADVDGLAVVERHGGTSSVLTDAQALLLDRLVQRAHWALGEGQQPLDLEWVFDGVRFWLVQARPVTSLPRVTADPVRQLPVIWSNGNLKDAVAGVPSALGYSVIQPVLRSILYTYLQELGHPVPAGMETIRRISGRVYFDLTTMQWLSYDAVGLLPVELNVTLGGTQPEIPVPPRSLSGPSGRRRRLARLRLLWLLWHSAHVYEREIASVRQLVRQRWRDDLTNLSNREIIAWRERSARVATRFSRLFQMNNAGGFWDKTLSDTIEKARRGAGLRISSGLQAGANGVVTAEHGYRLVELARLAEQEPAVLDYLAAEPIDPCGWRQLSTASLFRRAFERFLEEFGHRGVYEVEIANPRWIEDPTYLLHQIRAFVGQPPSLGARERATARRREAEREVATLPFWVRPAVRWLAARARRAAALREAGKSALVSTLLMTRMMTAELGKRMVVGGVLDQPDDIFHLTWWDIQAWAAGEWSGQGARALVADRAAQHTAWLDLEPPDVIVLDADGRPAQLPSTFSTTLLAGRRLMPAGAASTGCGERLTGAGVSAGRARGAARVIRHPDEGRRLQAGEILVAPSTDPGWTPLFLRAAAVVMEVGGYLSHGAIVAREYGLPAVVNVPGALRAIEDGQVLEVDGDEGTVTVTAGPPPAGDAPQQDG